MFKGEKLVVNGVEYTHLQELEGNVLVKINEDYYNNGEEGIRRGMLKHINGNIIITRAKRVYDHNKPRGIDEIDFELKSKSQVYTVAEYQDMCFGGGWDSLKLLGLAERYEFTEEDKAKRRQFDTQIFGYRLISQK